MALKYCVKCESPMELTGLFETGDLVFEGRLDGKIGRLKEVRKGTKGEVYWCNICKMSKEIEQ